MWGSTKPGLLGDAGLLLNRRVLAIGADTVEAERMISQGEVFPARNLVLKPLNGFIAKLFHATALNTHQMIVVFATVQLEYGIAAFEMMPNNEASGLKLGQDTVHSRQTDFLTFENQLLVYLLGAQMTVLADPLLQNLKDLDARQCDF